MTGYTSRDIAKMLDLPVQRVRALARVALLEAVRGTRGELRFAFQDLVLLQAAKGLCDGGIPARKVKRALSNLKRQLPSGRSLATVRIAAEGDSIVVRDGRSAWNPESGQALLDFSVGDLASKVAPFARRAAERARADEDGMTAEAWYQLGCDLDDAGEARDAFRRALELDPAHADAAINLGQLLHQAGNPRAAEAHYRTALASRPDDPIALFNLGVALEDQGRREAAVKAYERAIACDPSCADAHYNLSRLYERAGRPAAALRHLKNYRVLLVGR